MLIYAQQLMTNDYAIIGYDETIAKAISLFEEEQTDALIVMDGKEYKGILTQKDVVRAKIPPEAKVKSFVDYSFLGYYLGKTLKNDVPYFRGLKPKNIDYLKELGASMAATGSIALYHVEGETPEYKGAIDDELEKIQVDDEAINEVKEKYNAEWTDIDVIVIGCPHASIQEIKEVAGLLAMRGKPLKIPLYIMASRTVKFLADSLGYSAIIERYNGRILVDTCLIVSPIEKWYRGVATNSGKASFYFSSAGLNVRLDDIEKIIMGAP